MAAIKRTLLPPILKTVSLPTWSILPKVFRNSTNDLKSSVFACLYQCCNADLASGCFSANSLSRLRVMMCMIGDVYYTPCALAVTDENSPFDAPRHLWPPVDCGEEIITPPSFRHVPLAPLGYTSPKYNWSTSDVGED